MVSLRSLNIAFVTIMVLGCRGAVKQSNVPPNSFPWNPNNPPNWSDFKGKPRLFSNHTATTCSFIDYEEASLGDSVQAEVTVYFCRDSSWSMRKYENKYLLNHERRHFDLAEIQARKIREYLQAFDGKGMNDYHCYIELGRGSVFNDSLNRQYDVETNHSINKFQQGVWDRKIDSLLEIYEEYKNPKFRVSLGWGR